MTEGKISDFTASIMAALSNYALYSGKHPIVDELSERAFSLLKDLYAGEELSLTVIGDSLVFNNEPISEKGLHFDNFIKRLRKKGIEKIEIRRGVTIDEFRRFIADMISRNASFASAHISVGIIEVSMTSERYNLRALMEENISRIKEVFENIPGGTKLDIRSLEETVFSLMSALKREANVLSILSPVRTHEEYAYVHATNVSILTLFQAESFSMREGIITDVGLAGLLHDIGKVFVPAEVLEKQTDLNPDEWNALLLHPIHGARYLSSVPDMPKLAMIAAFEHHIKFNGSGYPNTKQEGRRQHVISQMVAISDFFDTLRTERPYRKPVEAGVIVNLLHQRAGKDFNPILVDNFVGSLTAVDAI